VLGWVKNSARCATHLNGQIDTLYNILYVQDSAPKTNLNIFDIILNRDNYPSFLQAVEHSGVGVCINQPNEISFALVQILNNYQEFSQNAFKEYDQRYRFENYEASLALFLKTSSGRKLN